MTYIYCDITVSWNSVVEIVTSIRMRASELVQNTDFEIEAAFHGLVQPLVVGRFFP